MDEIIQEKRQKLADVIQTARIKKGMSQTDLGELVGISYRTVGRIETCQFSPNLDIFYKIANALEIKIKLNEVEI